MLAKPRVTAQSASGGRLLQCDANGTELTKTSLCVSDDWSVLFIGVLTEFCAQKNYSERSYSCFLCLSDEVSTAIMLWNGLTSLMFVSFNAGVHKLSNKCRNRLRILDANRAACSKFHTEDTQILVATVQDLVATASSRRRFVHPRFSVRIFSDRILIWSPAVFTCFANLRETGMGIRGMV